MFYDSETRSNTRSFRFGIVVIILFVMSMVKSCTELKYTVWGEVTTATVTRTATVQESRRTESFRVIYHFDDAEGTTYEGFDRVEQDTWTMPEDRRIEIMYLPGNPDTNLILAQRSRFWVWVFLGMLAVFTIWCIKAYRDAEADRL